MSISRETQSNPLSNFSVSHKVYLAIQHCYTALCALRWPSRLGRQTHRVYEKTVRPSLGHLEIVGSDPTRSISIQVQICLQASLYPYLDLLCIEAFTAPTLTDREFHPVDKIYDIIGRGSDISNWCSTPVARPSTLPVRTAAPPVAGHSPMMGRVRRRRWARMCSKTWNSCGNC